MMGTGRTDYGGTIDELLDVMERGGIRRAVLHDNAARLFGLTRSPMTP